MLSDITVRPLSSTVEIAYADALREDAWHKGRPSQHERLTAAGYFAPATASVVFHYGAFHAQDIIGVGRISKHLSVNDIPEAELYDQRFLAAVTYPVASMNRLVVHPEFRQKGIASALDQARIARANDEACSGVFAWWTAKSGEHRLKQLRSYGFSEIDNRGVRRTKLFDETLPLWLPL
jgi:GNAT superfamily N-acetyltransferase